MFLVGLIGAREKKSAMESTAMSFGYRGKTFFAALNIIQLVGWTAIMIYDGAIASDKIISCGICLWAIIIAAFILIWTLIGLKRLDKINTATMLALFILTLILTKTIFSTPHLPAPIATGSLSFGNAVELAAAMPLSWLPLISDYTKEAQRPVAATAVSVVAYNLTSIFMYIIGMAAAIFTQQSDIAAIMLKAGLGTIGLLIIVFSTFTTAFLDVYSAGISAEAISPQIKARPIFFLVTFIGTAAAIFSQPDNIASFLYFIGSVFAPMAAVQIADYFLIKKEIIKKSFSLPAFFSWGIGFLSYRLLLQLQTPIGITSIDILLTILVTIIIHKLFAKQKTRQSNI